MAKKLNLVPLAKTDYQKLEEGDIIYDSWGNRWRVTAIKYSKRTPTTREISVKHGLHKYGKFKVNAGGIVGEEMFKTRGTSFHTAKSPGRGIKRGRRVVARVPLEQAGKVVKAGTRGVVKEIRPLTPAQSKQFHGGQKALLSVKWDKGGTFDNVYPTQITPA